MRHLNIRTTEEDEGHILFLKTKWRLDRSEATRKALALAVSYVKKEGKASREQLLKNSKFIGSESHSRSSSTEYKDFLKKSLKAKYGRL